MDGMEKDVSAIGGLFLTIMSDLRGSSPIWEDFTSKATKLHSSLKTTLIAVAGFLDAFQKVADMATGSRADSALNHTLLQVMSFIPEIILSGHPGICSLITGATKEIGSALTRLCMRHKSIETKLKHLTTTIIDNLVVPLQERMEDWKKTVAQLDKEHTKEYKRARAEIKKCAADTVRLQKKVKKASSETPTSPMSPSHLWFDEGKSDIQSRLENAMQDVNDKYMLMEEAEKNAVRTALIEERGRFCLFISCIKPFVDQEVGLLTEITHLQEIMDGLCLQADSPESLPTSSEQVIMDLKGLDTKAWSIQTTPPSSPSSLGSRKSSMCSISSITSSSSGSTQSHSPSHNKNLPQPLQLQGLRLTSVSSQDSGFTSQDTLFLRPMTPSSLSIQMQTAETASTGTDTPDVDSTPSTPSGSYPNTPSASSTWTNWPNPPNIGNNKTESGRPHTISSAYEKSHHSRPPLTSQLFEPPQQMATESVGQSTGEQHDVAVVKRERPHSGSSMPYSRPSAAINKMQPVLPPLGPKPKSRAIAPPVVPPMEVPIYANLKQLNTSQNTTQAEVDLDKTPTAREPLTPNGTAIQYRDELDLKEAIRDLDNYTAALHGDFSRKSADVKMQQNSLELAAAIKELEESTAALNYNYDTESQASQSSLQCSSGYGTMNSTPASSEDTIASGDFDVGQRDYYPREQEKYFTIPRNSNVYRAALLQAKRPASTAGVPVSAQGGVLTRRSSLNQPKPPPPVRRSSSITSAPNPAVLQKYRSSPPRQVAPKPGQYQGQSSTSQSNAHEYRQDQKPNHRRSRSASGSTEPAYAELTEIQQSIQARYQQQSQGQYEQSSQYGQYLQAGGPQPPGIGPMSAPAMPQYALPVTNPGTQYSTNVVNTVPVTNPVAQYSTNVVNTLNAKFAAMNTQMGQNSQSCPQFTGQTASHSDLPLPPPPASDEFPDLPPPPTEAELQDIEHSYVPNVDRSQTHSQQSVDLRHASHPVNSGAAPNTGEMRQSLISELKKGNMFRKMSHGEEGSEC